MRRKGWRPAPFLVASALLHGVLLVLAVAAPNLWRWALGGLLANHALITAAGLWPRSRWLGANLLHLPASAAARGEIGLTFDDGPDPAVTPHVLALLARYGARASFFCIGERAAAHPELVQAIVAAGHRIENHGWHHAKHCSLYGLKGWEREIAQAQTTLTQLSGQPPAYFRAMAGLRNPFLDPVLQGLGLQLATWTRRGYDTQSSDADRVLRRLTRGLAAGDILLLHDGHAARTPTGEALVLAVLPRLLATLAQRGLVAVSLPPPHDPREE